MTGVLNAMVAAASPRYMVVGVNGGAPTRVGWGTAASPGGARGSFSGSTSFAGQTLIEITSDTAFDVIVAFSGIQSQTLFTRIVHVDGAGAGRTYTTASATFATTGGNSFWAWGDGSNKAYVSGDSGETKSVQLS